MDSNGKRTDLLNQLGEQVERLRSSEGWLAWLQTASKFRSYSLRNQLLIVAQRPDATRVAGYRAWQALGRQVMKGERGIRILAPRVRRVDATEGDEEARRLVGFVMVSVFDVSQTSGQELSELTMPEVKVSDSTLFDRLRDVAAHQGIDVSTIDVSPNGARGWYEPTKRQITIVGSYPIASQVRTLLHELGHAFDPECASATGARDEREMVAESAAFLVGTALGVDLSDASVFYVATWGGDAARLEQLAARVLDVAGRLEAAMSMSAEVAA